VIDKMKRSLKRSLLAVGAVMFAFGIFAAGSVPAALAADTYQVRLVATPVNDTTPSFVAPLGNFLAWTGSYNGVSKMYVYDMLAGKNVYIDPGTAGSYYNPAAEDKYIAFQGATSGGYDDIYLYNTDTKTASIISSVVGVDGDQNDWNPRIQGGQVVWQKQTATGVGAGIYLYDVSTHTPRKLLDGTDYHDPDIYGDYVVCVKDIPSDAGPNASQIILYKISDGTTTTIAGGGADVKNNEHPRIDGTTVVWSSGDVWTSATASTWTTTYQVCVYDIGSGHTKVITSDLAGNLNPAVGGDLVVWQTWTPSTIKGYRISTEATFDISPHGDAFREPDVDGTRVTWWGSKGLYYAVPTGEATTFPDVPTGHHYLTAIESVDGKGFMAGYGDGDFGPNDWIIRQQFAQMIDLTMGYTVAEDKLYDFTDSPPIVHLTTSLYPYHYVAEAVLSGVMVTDSTGAFHPLYRERCKDAVASLVVAAGTHLGTPPDSFTGTLTSSDPLVTQNLRTAEYNHLLDNIVGSDGTLASWDPDAPATRAEIAQLLWNLYGVINPTT
jgi:hypothetical protein